MKTIKQAIKRIKRWYLMILLEAIFKQPKNESIKYGTIDEFLSELDEQKRL